MSSNAWVQASTVGAWLGALAIGALFFVLNRYLPPPPPHADEVRRREEQKARDEGILTELQTINTNLRAIRDAGGPRLASPPQFDVVVTQRRRSPRLQGRGA